MVSIRRVMAVALLATSVWLGGARAEAQVPQTLMHQGRLFDSAGAPSTGRQNITYRVYSAATGGMALWTESHMVTLDDGYFSVQLGDTTMLPANLFDGTPRFLGVTVGSDPEMTPREEIVSVPYALRAGDVTGDIHPRSVSIGTTPVIDSSGRWVGPSMGGSGPSNLSTGGCVSGIRYHDVCVTHWDNSGPGTDWNTAATTCAGLNSDLCSATQYTMLRYSHEGVGADLFYNDAVSRRAVWSKHFSDNDSGRLGFALQSADDPSIEFRYGFACCAGASPADVVSRASLVPARGSMLQGVRVTFLNNREDTTGMVASRICATLHSDLCSTAQYVTLNDAGRFSNDVRRLTNHYSDNDGSRFSSILGTRTADNPSWNNAWAFACCISQRPVDYSCPSPGMLINGVCVMEIHATEDTIFADAARACAGRNADICTNSQMQSIRNAGRFPGVRAWTNNGADNDAVRVGGLLSSMPDDPDPTSNRFGYACCL